MTPLELNSSTSKAQFERFSPQAREASELLKALSHETRLLILCILSEGEQTVSEIEAILGLQQAVVSQQLARLRMDHLVKTRRVGRMIYYSIDNPRLNGLLSVLYEMYCQGDEPERAAE